MEHWSVGSIRVNAFDKGAVTDEVCPISGQLELHVISNIEVGVHIDFENVSQSVISEHVGNGDGRVHIFSGDRDWRSWVHFDFLKNDDAVRLEDVSLNGTDCHLIVGIHDSADYHFLRNHQIALYVQAVVHSSIREDSGLLVRIRDSGDVALYFQSRESLWEDESDGRVDWVCLRESELENPGRPSVYQCVFIVVDCHGRASVH